ncbi:hypothetical protein CU669_19890 [Paramagnetospirillum kuznetsovii]|uniref:Tyr recombinase domain-containing protein n=1 Tax=Paramagnetospirillum kuznetsovii TaxID=2053833 RepID=A0A364NSU2_9PROT|nr:tyrosine-type recombinase/integrase [Paramagnetospirillum kuznetsovii]RAU20153.1 hypothetical protein CU669_19890 [Paramagnetospirillum kuznetsovii]
MGSIVQRRDRKGQFLGFQAKLRRVGFRPEPASQMFPVFKGDEKSQEARTAYGAAVTWMHAMEKEMDRGMYALDAQQPAPALTVQQAMNTYRADLKTRGGDTENCDRLEAHLSDAMAATAVMDLKAADLRTWRDGLTSELMPATVNRLSTIFKAALNLAIELDEGKTITSRLAWESGLKALPGAETSRNVILPIPVVGRLIEAAYGQSHSFGLFVEASAMTGARPVQLARLVVADLQDDRPEPRLMMPSTKKGRGTKVIKCTGIAIPVDLAKRLRTASAGKRGDELLLARNTGDAYSESNHHHRPFRRAVKDAGIRPGDVAPYGLDELTIYALRHTHIVHQIQANVPLRIIAALHDTSIQMLERHYSANIGSLSDSVARAALPPIIVIAGTPAKPSRQGIDGQCKHGHDYHQHPPYVNSRGSVVCAECARIRTKENKARRRNQNP